MTVPEGHGQIRAARLSYKTKHLLATRSSRFVAGENRDHESHRTARRGRCCAAVVRVCLPSLPKGRWRRRKGRAAPRSRARPGPGGSQGDNGLEHCDKPMGALAVVEPQDYVSQSLSRYGLQSPTGLIRMMVQQSNCFIVVERGIGMQNMMQERALQESGELRQNSNMGGGQMVSADFVLTPAVVFSENNAGGVGGALGGLLGGTQRQRDRRSRRRTEVQGSADQHAGRGRALGRAGRGGGRQLEEGGSAPRRGAVRRQRGRRSRRLCEHERRQGDRRQPDGQLQQRREVGAQPAEPAARRRHARGRSGQEDQERRGVQRRRHDRAEDRQREAVRLARRFGEDRRDAAPRATR